MKALGRILANLAYPADPPRPELPWTTSDTIALLVLGAIIVVVVGLR